MITLKAFGIARPSNRRTTRALLASALLLISAAALPAAAQAAPPAPAWTISSTAVPTNFAPGSSGNLYALTVFNSGGDVADASSEPITVTDTLPPGLEATEIAALDKNLNGASPACTLATLTCSFPGTIEPGRLITVYVKVKVLAGALPQELNAATVSGGGAPSASASEQTPISSTPAGFGIQGFAFATPEADGSPARQAGAHPYAATASFFFNTVKAGASFQPAQNPKDVEVNLPPGLIGDPEATPKCGSAEYAAGTCPADSQVGEAVVFLSEGAVLGGANVPSYNQVPVYNVVPHEALPAEFAFKLVATRQQIAARVRSDGDYGVATISRDISESAPVMGASVTFWGIPGDSSHDPLRGLSCEQTTSCHGGETPFTNLAVKPLLTSPTTCGPSPATTLTADPWQQIGAFLTSSSASPQLLGCDRLVFTPTIAAAPEPAPARADTPAGLAVDLKVPQTDSPTSLATPALRDATVTLPQGMAVSPSSADGLAACQASGPQGINLGSGQLARDGQDHSQPEATERDSTGFYIPAPGHCPPASTLGTVEVISPLLAQPLQGHIFLGTPECAPCSNRDAEEGKLVRLYIEAAGSGVIVKLPGSATVNPVTGQIAASFKNTPQLPFEELKVRFKSGPRAALVNPPICGTYTTTTDLTPWSAPETPDATPSSSFAVNSGPTGGPCASSEAALPNEPSFEAGTTTPIAGAYSPFALRLSREDGSQRVKAIDTTLPAGLVGKLAGIPYCSDAAIVAARSTSGNAEKASPSCPLASEVGTVEIAAGPGSTPFHVQGHAYLAGPYKGAPLSLAIITPALAGPFDLGTVAVRTALYVDETTAQIHAVSDEIPHILAGIPLDVRSIALNMNRPNFTLNPTSCEPKQVIGSATSTFGNVAPLQNRFQVGACGALGFKPKLKLQLKGSTQRGKNPALKAGLTQPAGQANIGRVSVVLPKSEFIDNRHVSNPCTRVQFNAGPGNGAECPVKSILGYAKAWSPLLAEPLQGPVYFRSNGGERELPDLVASLSGQIHVNLVGFIDSVHKKGSEVSRTRNTFATVPDAPVSRFVLNLKGGNQGLLQNSANLCKVKNVAQVKMTGQNGKPNDFGVKVTNQCGKKSAGKKAKR